MSANTPILGETLNPIISEVPKVVTTSDIRLVSESVDIQLDFIQDPFHYWIKDTEGYIRPGTKGHVTSTYILRNESNKDIIDFRAGYFLEDRALLDPENANNSNAEPSGSWNELRDYKVSVDGVEMPTKELQVELENTTPAMTSAWASWAMDFGKAGSDAAEKTVVVEYNIYSHDDTEYWKMPGIIDLPPSEVYTSAAHIYYKLRPGRGWKGKIDSSIIRMRFPEEVELAQKIIEVESDSEYCQTADCDPVTFSAFQIHPSDYRVDAENNTLVWERTDWNPKANLSSYDEDYAGDDIVIEFMYPETLAFFDEHFETKSTTPLAELSEPFDYGDTNDDNDGQEREGDAEDRPYDNMGGLLILAAVVAGLGIGVVWRKRRDRKDLQ